MNLIITIKTTVPVKVIQVVKLLSQGHSVRSAAKKLRMNDRTAERWLEKLRSHYKCKTNTHLVATLIRKGVIK